MTAGDGNARRPRRTDFADRFGGDPGDCDPGADPGDCDPGADPGADPGCSSLPADGVLRAQRDAALDALQALCAALPERFEFEFAKDSRSILRALRAAQALLAQAGRLP